MRLQDNIIRENEGELNTQQHIKKILDQYQRICMQISNECQCALDLERIGTASRAEVPSREAKPADAETEGLAVIAPPRLRHNPGFNEISPAKPTFSLHRLHTTELHPNLNLYLLDAVMAVSPEFELATIEVEKINAAPSNDEKLLVGQSSSLSSCSS